MIGNILTGLSLALALGTASMAGAAESDGSLAVTLAPIAAPAAPTQVGTVDVILRFDGVAAASGEPLLRLPMVSSNVDTVATVIAAISARDAKGPLRLTHRDVDLPETGMRDAVGGGPSREWIADRAVEGTVTVRYSVPAEATLPPRGPAPPFSFTADGGGVSAAGHVFLLLPPGDHRYRTSYGWDLSRAPKGSRGVSSLGEGSVTAAEPLDGAQIRMSFFMAGRIGTFPPKIPTGGFFGAWQGAPAFDAGDLLAWTGALYDRYARFFDQKESPPYGVFLRYNPINAGGGVGLFRSFVATFGRGKGSDAEKIKLTLAHEMFHTFQPFIARPAGLESSWFGEGLATFYQARLPFRFGMITPEAYLADINWTAARYYTSAMATVPNREVPRGFWADTRIRTLPYDRGMLYFATVDDAMRKASGGAKSLDDLMFGMLALEKAGRTTDNGDWEKLLAEHLGPSAVEDFRAYLNGAMPLPASDAFGPCFRRTTAKLRRYELGFATEVLAQPKRIVRGLVPGSAAALAGLRDGDEIVDPVPQDGIQGEQTELIRLRIRRGMKTFPVTYLPRGETVQAYQWEPVPGESGKDCAL
ncbi:MULTISPECIES: M61 family metallopeptidase [unclassified Sphingomonas]|uniref:M61 family metallopeptidase n=1 Tax=unclassified Sphingomonas TaxID=196159 RepID=UPI0006F2D95D|nr:MULTISPECIES: peptidase M61 [unclassified Sphingomonas]KQX25047.1 peptidase M61 [Sphingomonas sp. Root1294]KQY66064.1 peptidase M61 [Sphingomonas sp. Root50]KRB89772.1 peptidase M61 [Sphingomonas sp. Root720]